MLNIQHLHGKTGFNKLDRGVMRESMIDLPFALIFVENLASRETLDRALRDTL